jgi:hypothetical protein
MMRPCYVRHVGHRTQPPTAGARHLEKNPKKIFEIDVESAIFWRGARPSLARSSASWRAFDRLQHAARGLIALRNRSIAPENKSLTNRAAP